MIVQFCNLDELVSSVYNATGRANFHSLLYIVIPEVIYTSKK